jgi:hypothetical protein
LRRRPALRRAVLAVGGRNRGARVGRQRQKSRAVRSRKATRGKGGGAREVAGGEPERRLTPVAQDPGGAEQGSRGA